MSKRICAGILRVVIKEVRLSRLGRLGAIERVVRGFESGRGCCPKTRMSEYVKKTAFYKSGIPIMILLQI